MVDLNQIVSTLRATRQELAAQLEAIDKAITALTSAQPAGSAEPTQVANGAGVDHGEAHLPLVPTRLKPKRVFSDAHKEALITGQRKAREAREAAAGRAREMLDESFVPALAPGSGTQPPRLIKK